MGGNSAACTFEGTQLALARSNPVNSSKATQTVLASPLLTKSNGRELRQVVSRPLR